MNFSATVFVIGFCLVHQYARASDNFIEDYCWRDYDGLMPSDALKGGADKEGKPIYIGQVLFENKLIPGKVHENNDTIHFEFRQAYTANETIKILCTNRPERFVWISARYTKIVDIAGKYHLFQGGYEKGYNTYIGRAKAHGEITVGKVMCRDDLSHCIPLSTVENGSFDLHNDFEILTYDPTAKPTDHDKQSGDPETDSVEKPSFVLYLLLVMITALLLVLMLLLLRHC